MRVKPLLTREPGPPLHQTCKHLPSQKGIEVFT